MKSYIITYSYPQKYRGTYLVQAKDGFEASSKVQKYVIENFGSTDSSQSIVVEVEGDSIKVVH